MPAQSSASWYPDPFGRHELRYWDGTRWTEHVFTQGRRAVDAATWGPSEPVTQQAGSVPEEPFRNEGNNDDATASEAPRSKMWAGLAWLIKAGVAVGAFDSRPTVGARVAYERGDETFECEIPVSETAGDTIDDVQEIGWQFESVEYEEDETSESGWVGQYEFRRVEREP